MSNRSELELIKKGRANGLNDNQIISIVKYERHLNWVAAERARQKREEKERIRLHEEEVIQMGIAEEETVNLKDESIVFSSKTKNWAYNEFEYKDDNWYHKESNKKVEDIPFAGNALKNKLEKIQKKSLYIKDVYEEPDFSKITLKSGTWKGEEEGEDEVLSDQILDYRDDDYVADLLNREYGHLGFAFHDTGSDQLTVYYKGKEHTFEINQQGPLGSTNDTLEALKLRKWMEDIHFKFKPKEEQEKIQKRTKADYRPIKNEKGELEWHYVIGEEDLGVIKEKSLLDNLNDKHKDALNEYKWTPYKPKLNTFQVINGKWNFKNENGEWEIADEQRDVEMDMLYEDAKEDERNRKKGEEARIYTHNLTRLDFIEEKQKALDYYNKVKGTSYEEYMVTEWPKRFKIFQKTGEKPGFWDLITGKDTQDDIAHILSNIPDMLKDFHAIRFGDYKSSTGLLGREDYENWIASAKEKLPEPPEMPIGPLAYTLDANGDYTVRDSKIKELEELGIDINESNLTISKEQYENKLFNFNIDRASIETADIEQFWGEGYKETGGENSISKLVEIFDSLGLDHRPEAREYTFKGETFDITEKDIDYYLQYLDNRNKVIGKEKVIEVPRKYVDPNLVEEYRSEDTTPLRKQQIKNIIKRDQPEWSKFYDAEDLPDNIDVNDFEEYIKEQITSGRLSDEGIIIATHGVTEMTLTGAEGGNARLRWDEKKGKFIWSGGATETDFRRDIKKVTLIDRLRAQVLTEYLSKKKNDYNNLIDDYGKAGLGILFDEMNEYDSNIKEFDNKLKPIISEYDQLKSDIDSGVIEKSEENIEKLNNLSAEINIFSKIINSNIDSYNKITNNPRNQLLFEGYDKLTKKVRNVEQGFITLVNEFQILPNGTIARDSEGNKIRNTTPFNIIAREMHEKNNRRQERLEKLENGHAGWQIAATTESIWQSVTDGVTGVLGLADAYVFNRGTATEKAQIMNKWDKIGNSMQWDAVAEGQLVDPITHEVNWVNLAPSVGPVVADMALMFTGAGAVSTTAKYTGKIGTKIVRKQLSTRGLLNVSGVTGKYTNKYISGVSKTKNYLGKVATKTDMLNRVSQFSGGMMVMYPKNIQESIAHIDENFTAKDALNSAFTKSVTESMLEMINPDLKWLKGFKSTKSWKNPLLWNNGANWSKVGNFLWKNAKQVPWEMVEENMQEAANALWNMRYNNKFQTDFHIPTAADFKALNIITPVSVLAAGFSRAAFTKGGPDASMYQSAIENIEEWTTEMENQVDLWERDKANGVPENKRKGIPPNSYKNEKGKVIKGLDGMTSDVFAYAAIKNGISAKEYQNMTQAERTATISLLLKKEQLKKDIKAEKDSKKKAKLEVDLKNNNLQIKRIANTVDTGYYSRQEGLLDYEIENIGYEMAQLVNNGKVIPDELNEKLKKKIKERNEFREKSSKYEFDGKYYNSTKDFIEAIETAEKNGYFTDGSNRPRIRISNKVSTEIAEILVNKINKLTGKTIFKSGEVLMSSNDVQETKEFINSQENRDKGLEEYQNELIEETKKNKPDDTRLNDLNNAINYLELQERGYENNETAGGMVSMNVSHQAVLDESERRLTNRIKSIKEITDIAGIEVEVYSQAQIEDAYKRKIFQDKGAITANAFIHEYKDENGNWKRMIVINSDIALQKRAFTAPSHELLHMVLFSVLNGPSRTVKGPDGEFHSVRITKKGVKLIEGFLDLLPPDQRKKLEDAVETRGYKHEKWDYENNKPVKGTEKPFEAYAEEYLTVYHDLVVKDKTIPLNEPETINTFKKIKNWLVNFWKQEVSEELQKGLDMDTHLDTPTKILEFMRNFNKQAIENKFDDQLIEMATSSEQLFTDIVSKEVTKPDTQYSRNERQVEEQTTQKEREDLAKETNDIWADEKLTIDEKAFNIAQKYGGMAVTRIDVAKANAIEENRRIFDLYRSDMIAEMTYDLPEDPDLKSRNVIGLVKDYPAYVAKQEAAGLDVAPLSGFINRWFKVRSYDVFKKYTKDKGFKKSMDDAINEISKMEADEVKKREDEAVKSGRVLVSDRIIKEDPHNEGKIDRVNKYNEDITNRVKEDPSIYEGQDYKTLTDLNPTGTVGMMMFDPTAVYKDDGTPFWKSRKGKALLGTSILESIVNKLANNDNLNQQDIKALQPFISKHNQLLWTALPEGFMTDKNDRPTTATGVQNVLLAPFYNKGRRAKNLWPQRKKSRIDTNEFLDVFGIMPSGEVNIVGKESNVSQRVKALIAQHGKIMTNQQVRKTLFENGADSDVINRIANGKSKMVYSKDPQLGDVNPETNIIEPGFGNRESQRVGELIQVYHNDPRSYRFMKELDPIFVGVVEDVFINPDPNLQRGVNYIPSIILDKYTPKEFLKKNFGEASYKKVDKDKKPTPQIFDGKNPGNYQVKYVRQAMEFGLTIHPDFDFKTLSYLLGFKDGKSINPKLYGLELSKIENRSFTPQERLAEEKFMTEHLGKDASKIIKGLVPMIMSTTEIKNIINDISTQKGLKAKLAKKAEYRSKIIAMNKANTMAMKYISLKMKQAYNDSKIISPHFVYFVGQMQTNIIEGTRALSTFEYMYLIEGQQVPLMKVKGDWKVYPKPDRSKIGFNLTKQFLQDDFGEDFKIIKPTQKDIGEVLIVADQVKLENAEYYASQEWKNYIKAWKKVDEWKERYEANKNKLEKDLKSSDVKKKTKAENDVEKAGSKKAAIEVATINDLTWKNEHVGASATTHAERSSYIWSNGKSIDLAILGNDHRSAWVPKYLADKYFDAKIKIGGKEVDNKVSYEGPMRMTKFGKGKSKNIYHAETGMDLASYLTEIEGISEIVQDLRELNPYQYEQHKTVKKATQFSRTVNPAKGMSVWDFDDTLATTKSNVLFTTPEGIEGKLNAEEYASQYVDLAAKGYVFDFSEFDIVIDGKIGPFFRKFQDRIKKFGVKNNFILTARPVESAPAIREFLLSQGIDVPLENITGLGNSTGEAKALWMTEKVADGYNDIYFADDSLANIQSVKNVLDQLDIKGKVQQAKIQFSKSMDPTFNDILNINTQTELDINRILEQTKGVKAEAVFSEAQAKIRGSRKGRWKFWVPYSAEDFKGLVYRFIGKGRQGETQMAFFKKALFDPYGRAYEAMNASKQQLNNQYRTLLKEFKGVKKDLKNKISSFEGFDNDFTVQQAIRVYLWNKNGMEVPGLSQRDLKTLVEFVESQSDIKAFADNLGLITNQEQGYLTPNEYWMVENIQSDINKINNEINRADHLAEWKQNIEIMFGTWGNDGRLIGDNINKIEAIYGTKFREALEDILWRMEFGTKREAGSNRLVNTFNNWANQSVGAIMFFNMRSALLQTISSINYLNWSDNNPLKAGLALANFPQFIKDFTMIFNSDMLKQRRAGNQRGINEAELAEAVAGSRNKPKAMLNWLLTKGFLPTQIADSFAIASGGATFYRNRINTYLKQGLTQEQAQSKAWEDFQENTEESQQSARPDMISQQQASPLGRYILAFKNTPMQYARLTKKAFLDLVNGRGDAKTNIGKIMYYMAVQNLIFSALQSALGAMIGADDDDEDKTKAKERVVNSMIDSVLGGLGFAGNVVMTIKNTLLEYVKQEEKGQWTADHTYTILKFFGLSPTIGSKGRKLYSAIQEYKFNKDVIKEMNMLDIDNPRWAVIANIISATTNIPLDRLVKKIDNIDAAFTEDITAMERLALLMGWNTWDLDVDDSDVVAVEEEIKEKKKEKKKIEKKEKKKKKEEETEKENLIKEEKNKELQKKEKEEGKKDIKCAAISKKGTRCKTTIESGSSYCTVHIKVEQGTKEVQCKKIKSDKKRCKMKTKAKSGLCYYHD